MANREVRKTIVRKKRTLRVRKKLHGSNERPRICVIKTNLHVHVQVIDDERHFTLASASTLSEKSRKSCESGKKLGLQIAEALLKLEIKKAVLDRGPFKYHGVIAAVADGAREGGLEL